MDNKQEFLDKDQMTIVFSSLILNVSSVNEKFGALKDFMSKFDLNGQTNGELLIVAEMVSPPYNLINIVETKLQPMGFIHRQDYVFAQEELINGAGNSYTPYLNQSHPDCKNISWLGSVIKTDGNFVWYKKISENENKEPENLPINNYIEEEDKTIYEEISLHREMKNLRAKKNASRNSNTNKKTAREYKVEYMEKLSKLDDQGFIELFNSHVGKRYFNIALQGYLGAIYDEFAKRDIDFSAIGDEKGMSFAKKVILIGKKIYTL